METKVGIHIQSSFSKYKNNADPIAVNAEPLKAKSMNSSMNVDTFSLSPKSSSSSSVKFYDFGGFYSKETLSQIHQFQQNLSNSSYYISNDDYDTRAKMSYDNLFIMFNGLNKEIAKQLKSAGVPENVTFEFDYNIDTQELEVTNISDERYLEKVKSVLSNVAGYTNIPYIAFGSRMMNGDISSMYYTRIAAALESSFGQDIFDLYIDENGNLAGANEKLQEALYAEKNTKNFDAEKLYDFPVNQIEAMLKRLITDENITPNISHMGYGANGVYTNDGDIKLDKDFDYKSFKDDRSFTMRSALSYRNVVKGDYDRWLNNEDLFY